MKPIKPIEWLQDKVVMLDQRKLPQEEVYVTCEDYKAVADAIRNMTIRGAPAIGVAAAMGVALGALGIGVKTYDEFLSRIGRICESLESTRPTAVNLFWATERMKRVCEQNRARPILELPTLLKEEALKIYHEDIETNHMIGRHGADLIHDGDVILTHCNAGALATAGFGTALGVLYAAWEAGKRFSVLADETRPFLQGARLTTWELHRHGIPVTLITDNMAGHLMQRGKVSQIIVGADRIAANGDTANKIGTYSVAVLAKHHTIPFYIAAPISTVDFRIPDGGHIPIEERASTEVTHIAGIPIAPEGVSALHPAFDVTPAHFIAGFITERGILKPPFR